jgi:serine/threonine protein kinase
LKIPVGISDECTDFIKKLLIRNPKTRLGAKYGFHEIKNHPWLRDINWDSINLKMKELNKYPKKQ